MMDCDKGNQANDGWVEEFRNYGLGRRQGHGNDGPGL
jgi:hypothetical protein